MHPAIAPSSTGGCMLFHVTPGPRAVIFVSIAALETRLDIYLLGAFHSLDTGLGLGVDSSSVRIARYLERRCSAFHESHGFEAASSDWVMSGPSASEVLGTNLVGQIKVVGGVMPGTGLRHDIAEKSAQSSGQRLWLRSVLKRYLPTYLPT
ncbi:hypothetical protein CHU98_g8260 [Xylaria longipes]|nr:hypothetical protein CHU98_g8260 [Xylaria longipes]